MKLKLILTTAIVGMALAVPSASSAQAPTQDSVTSEAGQPFSIFLDASSGPLGENPTGSVRWHEGGGLGPTWRGDVSCLSVSGNVAIIGFGDGYFSAFIPAVEAYWIAGLIRVVDNGPGPDDTFEWVELQTGEPGLVGDPLPGPADCSSFPPGGQIFPLSQNSPLAPGDIVVTDAQPFPTSRDQCKNGGWQQFGFANQGLCIAFVERGP
jgi:hypothetical protein